MFKGVKGVSKIVWICIFTSKNPICFIVSFIQPHWIQDSRLKAFGFKKSFWDLESWILPPWIQEVFLGSWILNPTPLDSRSFLWILNLESHPLWFKKLFFGILNLESYGILNLESYPLGFKKFSLDFESWIWNPTPFNSRCFLGILNLESWPWIQEVFLGSWILNLGSYPLGFKKCFLESWIFNPTPMHSRSFFWILNPTPFDSRSFFGISNLGFNVLWDGWDGNKNAKKKRCLITKKCPKALSFRVQNV